MGLAGKLPPPSIESPEEQPGARPIGVISLSLLQQGRASTAHRAWVKEGCPILLNHICLKGSFYNMELWRMRNSGGFPLLENCIPLYLKVVREEPCVLEPTTQSRVQLLSHWSAKRGVCCGSNATDSLPSKIKLVILSKCVSICCVLKAVSRDFK